MFGTMQTGVNAYARIGVETGVAAASPHKLISMLFDGAIVAIGNAVRHTGAGEIASKGQSISKAIAIIENGLRASLNKEAGGSIAESLDGLYQYMSTRLIQANLHSDTTMMEEVARLLRELKEAWDAIGYAATGNALPGANPLDPAADKPEGVAAAVKA